MIDPSTFMAGGLLIGFLAATWSKFKAAVARLVTYVIVTCDVEDNAASAVTAYLRRNFRPSRFGARRYRSTGQYVRPVGRRLEVGFEAVGSSALLFWKGWRPVLVRYRRQSTTEYSLGATMPLELTFLRGTFDADELVTAALHLYNAVEHGLDVTADGPQKRYRVHICQGTRVRGPQFSGMDANGPVSSKEVDVAGRELKAGRVLGWSREELGEPVPEGTDPFARMALNEAQTRLVRDIDRWRQSREWFVARGVPWRMGVLMYGNPGTGKTTFIRAACQALDVPVHIFDLSTYDNRGFRAAWDCMLGLSPVAAVIEDVDAVFHGRDNVGAGGDGERLTFDCLLNCISGVSEADGVLLFVTTNRLEHLDPALGAPTADGSGSTRPGRIDRAVEFGPLTEDGRRHVAGRILNGYPDATEAAVAAGVGESGAVFEDRCVRAALDLYWNRFSLVKDDNG